MQLGGTFWAFVPAGLLTAMLGGLLTMAVIAKNDPGFAIERDYYAKAVAYDAEMAQRETNARLGWRLAAACAGPHADGRARLVVRISTPGGPLVDARVTVQALQNARADRVLQGRLAPGTSGEYAVELPVERGGLWEFRFLAERGADRFTESVRLDLGERRP